MKIIIDDINKIPFKDRRRVTTFCFDMYKKMKNVVITIAKGEDKIAVQKNLSVFEAILSHLSEEHRLIIEKDFINVDNRKPHWSQEIWSKSTYYKFKNEAMNAFLLLLYA